jgi:predicted MFS family arabinose efflux permease
VSRLLDLVSPRRLGSGFRWLLASYWLTNLGDGFTVAAGPLLVASQTHSPALVAAAAFLQRLPWLLFGLYAGVLADRVNRRTIIITTNLVRAAVLLVLAGCIVANAVSIAFVLAALFVLGLNETFAVTTSGTLLPMLVAKDDLGIANSRLVMGLITTEQIVGPPVGAALFALGMALPFAGEFVLVLIGAALVTKIRLPPHAEEPANSRVWHDIAEGWRWLWAHPAVRTLALTILTFNVTYGAAWSVLVLYARERLGMGEVGFGLVTTAIAVGGLLGTASFGRLQRRFSFGIIMRIALVTETFVHLALALLTWAPAALVVFGFFGAEAFVWGTTSTTVRQRAVPQELQGRVNSVYLMAVFGGLVLGAAIGGALAQVWGVTAPFWFAFAGSVVILSLIWRALTQIAHDDPRERSLAG